MTCGGGGGGERCCAAATCVVSCEAARQQGAANDNCAYPHQNIQLDFQNNPNMNSAMSFSIHADSKFSPLKLAGQATYNRDNLYKPQVCCPVSCGPQYNKKPRA
jgi:hypothetical protein